MSLAMLDVQDLLVLQGLNKCRITEDKTYLEHVSEFVSAYKFKRLTLKNPPNAVLKLMGLDDTLYREKPDECNELVLMTCEDKNVYAYDGEELHLVASSLEDLIYEGIEYPASRSFYKGEAFTYMTEKDWAKVKEGAVWKSLKEDHLKLAESKKSTFLANLKSQK